MKPLSFSSSLNQAMAHFVELKQYSGSDYRSQAKLLLRFDRYLSLQQDRQTKLQPLAVQSYLATLSHLSSRGFCNHYCVLQQFSRFLNQYNPASYILPPHPVVDRSHSRAPYIFSLKQVACFLEQCNNIDKNKQVIPSLYRTLFSVLYSTGIRISEALALDVADYDSEEKLLHIRLGKFRKERYVVLSVSCAAQLMMYIKRYQCLLNPDDQAPLFINVRHQRLSYQSAMRIFHTIIIEMGINKTLGSRPRIHDFRHTFAVHRLLQWVESSDNLNAKLPILSTYMGHVNVTSTQVYLQATSELLSAGSRRFQQWALIHLHDRSMDVEGVIL